MEGRRFGVGLAAGLVLGLALVAVSGGLGATPLAYFSSQERAASTTTAASVTTVTMTSTSPQTVSITVESTTTTGGSSIPSQNSNVSSATTSTTTTTRTATSISASTTTNSGSNSQSAAGNANGGTTYSGLTPAENHGPSRLVNITQQPIVSNTEILVPVVIAFLLGAFLYRVALREREGPGAEG